MQDDSAKLLDFAARYTAAWCSQNAASVAAFFAPEASLTINRGASAIGRDAITVVAQSFMTAFPDLHVFMDRVIVRDDLVEYYWTLTGANTGPGGTGKRVRISGLESWRMGQDGLIAESRGQFDAEDYNRQLEHGAPDQG